MDIPRALGHMLAAGQTTATLAQATRVTRRSVQRWLAGRHTPSPSRLAALRAHLDYLQQVAAAGTRREDERQHEEYRNARRAFGPRKQTTTPQTPALNDGRNDRVLVRNRNGRVVDSYPDPSNARTSSGRPSITTTEIDIFALFEGQKIHEPLPF